MKLVTVPEPSQFDKILSEQLKEKKNLYVLVIGANDPKTGVSWCGDCVQAHKPIMSRLSSLDCILLECPVERAEYSGKPNHPYRKHSQLKIVAVPTLIHWGNSAPKERLVERECYDETLLNEFMEETTQ